MGSIEVTRFVMAAENARGASMAAKINSTSRGDFEEPFETYACMFD